MIIFLGVRIVRLQQLKRLSNRIISSILSKVLSHQCAHNMQNDFTFKRFATGISTLCIHYIPRNMHTVFALLCFVVVIHWLVFPAPSHYLNQCWNIVNWILRNKPQWNFNWNSNIFIQEMAFENVVCKIASILSQPQRVKQLLTHALNIGLTNVWTNANTVIMWAVTFNSSHPWIKWPAFSQTTFSNSFSCISITISMKFVPQGPIDNKSVLVQVIAWCLTGNTPLPQLMLTQFTDAHMRN